MPLVAVVGAGEIGGAVAHKLVQRGRVTEVRLVDPAEAVATGKALDIQQAAAIEGSATKVTAASDWWAAAGARVIVLADAAGSTGEWLGDAGLVTLGRLADLAPRAGFVLAGAVQRALLERGAAELGLRRDRLVGSAPTALEAAVRALVAVELGFSHAEVQVGIAGAPPEHLVIGWSHATARGVLLSDLLPPPAFTRLAERARHLWPPGPYAAASAAARVAEALATGGSPRLFACFVVLDDEVPGARGRVAAMPVRLGAGRVQAVIMPGLSRHERVQLENAIAR